MPSQRTHTTQSRKHARKALPARFANRPARKNCGNGFVWHTTGSGKMLTSFKASTPLKGNDHIHKCLFVGDCKDLDRQTREDWSSSDKTSSKGEALRVSAGSANQFNKFQEGCVEGNNGMELRNNARLFAGETELSLVA